MFFFSLKERIKKKKKDNKGKQPKASIVESSFTYIDALTSTLDQANHVTLGKHD